MNLNSELKKIKICSKSDKNKLVASYFLYVSIYFSYIIRRKFVVNNVGV